jgi:hypothetical protein
MAELSDYGITKEVMQEMYHQWCQGAKKSDLERRYLDKPESHGGLFDAAARPGVAASGPARCGAKSPSGFVGPLYDTAVCRSICRVVLHRCDTSSVAAQSPMAVLDDAHRRRKDAPGGPVALSVRRRLRTP